MGRPKFHHGRDILSAYNQLDKSLKSPAARHLVEPFVPPALRGTRLKALADSCVRSVEQQGGELLATGSELDAELRQYLADAEDVGTEASRLVAAVVDCWRTAVRQEIESRGLTKPAWLALEPLEKRYPRHSPNLFPVRFRLINEGAGPASEISVEIEECYGLELAERVMSAGALISGTQLVETRALADEAEAAAVLSGEVRWRNADGTRASNDFLIEFPAQDEAVDWEALEALEPYGLEPVTDEEELVGRKEALDRLLKVVAGRTAGNAFISGQKRVGKTSIVRALLDRLRNEAEDFIVLSVEGGDFVVPDPRAAVRNFGEVLCSELAAADARLAAIEVPDFSDGFAPIIGVTSQARRLAPSARIVIAVDEFDELPRALLQRGAEGDSFFLSLRSLSGKDNVSLVLIGGEKMTFILNAQGDVLNKFEAHRVDYFTGPEGVADYRELVRRPVAGHLDISDGALSVLHEQTAGNPYFTHLICREMVDRASAARDAHITELEMRRAIEDAITRASSNSFQHFWEDGILDGGDAEEAISITRRKVLLGLADCIQSKAARTTAELAQAARRYDLSEGETTATLRSFEDRKVLRRAADDSWKAVVPIFELWLRDRGTAEVLTTFGDEEGVVQRLRAEDAARVRFEELRRLAEEWGTYQGRLVNPEELQHWLTQFGGPFDQRAMFQVLRGVNYYSQRRVRAKLVEAHEIVVRALAQAGVEYIYKGRERKRRDIAVTYLDGPGKSGALLARLYRDENGVLADMIVEPSALPRLFERTDVAAVVCVDDLIGTGRMVSAGLEELDGACGAVLREAGVRLFLTAVAGTEQGREAATTACTAVTYDAELHVCDALTADSRVFSTVEGRFSDGAEQERARELTQVYGSRLEPKHPLGYGNCELAVVFEHRCPNNTLPVLWKSGPNWDPVFPRH
ncbi:MAG: ATP-binding protein [Chloroflexota bacterium]|nr:ATP-binding protein [Chloroflexota bacterium]